MTSSPTSSFSQEKQKNIPNLSITKFDSKCDYNRRMANMYKEKGDLDGFNFYTREVNLLIEAERGN